MLNISETAENWFKPALLLCAGLISACNSDNDKAEPISLSGVVFASNVAGAQVVVQDINGNQLAGPVTTASDGGFSFELAASDLSGEVRLVSTGGTFSDEATNLDDRSAGQMSAHIGAGSVNAAGEVNITPASTIVAELVAAHGKTLSEAQDLFKSAFGYMPDVAVQPHDVTGDNANIEKARLLEGLRAAAFSQLAFDLGLTSAQQFELFAALAKDLGDGKLDGQAAGAVTVAGTDVALPGDVQNHFNQAMVNFRAGNYDNSGLSNTEIGSLPFARHAMSASYAVEYVDGMMEAMEGKTTFTLKITDRSSGQAASGLAVSLMPMMNMAAHMHGTPVASVTDNGDGTYTASVYYLMGSSMMSGMSMGYWQLKVMIGGMMGESVIFYPQVMMAMGDSAKATLKGVNDKIEGMAMDGGMAMPENRSYYLFKEALSGSTGSHTLKLFLAAKEGMMSYPAVTGSSVLNQGDATYELTVASISVQVSTDKTTWVVATEEGNGVWSATGLTGLTDGTQGTVYVKLMVNGEQKTTDGAVAAGDGSNDYAMFMLTPGGSMSKSMNEDGGDMGGMHMMGM